MALYLTAESAITSAHAYINSASAAALRMGLHQAHAFGHLPLDERLLRERAYRSLKALDIFVSTFLGLPCYLPACSDDEQDRYDSAFPNRNVQSHTFELHVEANFALLNILGDTVQKCYFNGQKVGDEGVYRVHHQTLDECNGRLDDEWRSASDPCRRTSNAKMADDISLRRVQYTYAYVRVIANAPFLHYITASGSKGHTYGYACALRCVAAAIELAESLQLLMSEVEFSDGHFIMLSGLAFAATTLLAVELTNADVPGRKQAIAASGTAQALLKQVSMRRATARDCFTSLQVRFLQ